jgi:phasin family protein
MTEAGKTGGGFLAHDWTNSGFRFSGPEVEMIFAGHRRNVEAVMQVSRLALDGTHAIWRSQLNFIQVSLGGLSTHVRDGATAGPLSDKLARYIECSKQAFERALANAQELADLVNKATGEAMNVINKRACEGVGEWRYSENGSGETKSV